MWVDGSYGNGWETWEWMRKTREMRGEGWDGWEEWEWMAMRAGSSNGIAAYRTDVEGEGGTKKCPLDGSIFCDESSGITPRPFFLRVFP